MEPKKLKRRKYFTNALLEIGVWVFIEEELRSCANIISAVEKLIVWHKAITTYRYFDTV